MSKCTISIIIAMYNIQDYIIQCLDSCANQISTESDDFEVIIVNDGSVDNSPRLVQEFINNKPSFRMINRENGGLSAARNTGLFEAEGEYVWFVDGDDAIAPNAISVLKHYIDEYRCDAYLHNFSTFEKKELLSTSDFHGYPQILSGKEIHDKYLRILPMMAWLTVYKRSVLLDNHLRFKEGIIHEDMEFSIRGHHCARTIKFVPESLYFYRVARIDSIMNDSRKENTRSLVSEIEIIKSFKAFFQNEDSPFSRKVIGMCSTSFLIRRYDDSFVENDTTLYLLSKYKTEIYRDMWRSRQWKRRALLVLIICLPHNIVAILLHKLGERSKLM